MNELVSSSAIETSDGLRIREPSLSVGGGVDVVELVDDVALGAVAASVEGADVTAGATPSAFVHPPTATTAVSAAAMAHPPRCDVVVVLITVSLQERRQDERQPADAPGARLCAR